MSGNAEKQEVRGDMELSSYENLLIRDKRRLALGTFHDNTAEGAATAESSSVRGSRF